MYIVYVVNTNIDVINFIINYNTIITNNFNLVSILYKI